MTHPVIISCALTGAGDTTAKSPHVPVTPAQIATEALAARAAGAAIVHIHVRDPETGRPSTLPKLYAEVVSRIREARSDVLINLTTGPGGRFVPDAIEPNHNAYPDGMLTSERRMQHVLDLRPDICSLDVGTLNFGTYSFINHPKEVERMAHMMREAGVKPELEVFDLGHAAFVRELAGRKVFAEPPWLQFCLGISWGAPASTECMQMMKQIIPPQAQWSAFGVSRHQFSMAAQAVILGGHVRVGLQGRTVTRQCPVGGTRCPHRSGTRRHGGYTGRSTPDPRYRIAATVHR